MPSVTGAGGHRGSVRACLQMLAALRRRGAGLSLKQSCRADGHARLLPEMVAVETRPVAMTDILDEHMMLDSSCPDRIHRLLIY